MYKDIWSQKMHAAQNGGEESYKAVLSHVIDIADQSLYGPDKQNRICDILGYVHRARHTYSSNRKFDAWLNAILKYEDRIYKSNHH